MTHDDPDFKHLQTASAGLKVAPRVKAGRGGELLLVAESKPSRSRGLSAQIVKGSSSVLAPSG